MNIAKYIDHTALKPEATLVHIGQLCNEGKDYGFASVCINPSYIVFARQVLSGSLVKVCTVIGFPLGANSTEVKLFEARCALADGADELDMVINIGRLKLGDVQYVKEEIFALAEIAHANGQVLKVIIETGLLNDDEKRLACRLAKDAGADFVKTSSGFSGGGATIADILLMRATVGPDMGIKASGGIGDYLFAKALIDAGATRLGTSKAVTIMQEALTQDMVP